MIYIGSIVEWFTAGERNNILYAFTVYAGQVILKNPVSVICLGEASSGKSHIQETALRLIPERFIVNEKKITEAALFNRAKRTGISMTAKLSIMVIWAAPMTMSSWKSPKTS